MTTQSILNFSNSFPPAAKQAVGAAAIAGGAASTTTSIVLAAKATILVGVAAHAVPIVGTIIGIALMVFGSYVLYQSRKTISAEPISLTEIRKNCPPISDQQQISSNIPQEVAIPIPTAEAPKIEKKFELSMSDKMLAASNALQWGLIGAAAYGVAPAITVPLSMAASVGSEIATFCMLPNDASLIRKAMALPVIPKMIIGAISPIIPQILQAHSLYTTATQAASRFSDIWRNFKSDPIGALKVGATQFFNTASAVAFAADSAGLIDLKPKAESLTKPCDPLNENNCLGPTNRKVRIVTVYDNKGDPGRQALSDATAGNHKRYAQKWGLEHEISTKNLVSGECQNPLNKWAVTDCTPYWNKTKYFKNWCETPKIPGTEEWTIYADDDAIFTNLQINPMDAIDQLRDGKDTSFIIATEGKGTRYNAGAVNTGVMIVRKDDRACGLFDRVWKNRNFVTDENDPNCPTYGLCKNHRNAHEQGATDKVLWRDAPSLVGKDISRILARDSSHPLRGHIALNTMYRGGCFVEQAANGVLGEPFDITPHDLKVNPDGIWQKGDWIGQTAGYPLHGQDLSHQPMGKCTKDPSIPIEPIRLKKVNQMLQAAEESLLSPLYKARASTPNLTRTTPNLLKFSQNQNSFKTGSLKRHIIFGTASDNAHDVNRENIANFVNQNHDDYAKKWNLQHEAISGNLVKDECIDPNTKTSRDCSAYWNKIAMFRKWLAEPKNSKFDEEWRYFVDDDMVVTNQTIDPAKAIDQLRGSQDTSIIIAQDVIDWQRWFFPEAVPNTAVNTGAIIVRKDDQSRALFDELWNRRFTRVDKGGLECPTIGICKRQDLSMQEQEAFTMLLRENPHLMGNIVTVVPPRDKVSPTRSHIAMNTFYRHGCLTRKMDGTTHSFTFDGLDTENPEGAFQKGDWLTQPAGVPVWGKDLPFTLFGNCVDNPSVPEGPIRLKRLEQLVNQTVK